MRLATPADLPAVSAISTAAYAAYRPLLGRLPLPATEDYLPRIAAGQVWLSTDGGAVVGLAVIETHPDHLLIYSLAIRPERHGQGLGRNLLAFAEGRARVAGVAELRLHTNALMARNRAIYGRAGYVETGTRPHPQDPALTVVDMAKRL